MARASSRIAVVAALAAIYGNAAQADEGWNFTFTPYLWAAGIDGDISVRDRDANVSVSFSDLAKNLDGAGAFLFEANKGHWVNWLQFDYFALSVDDVGRRGLQADLQTDVTMYAAGTGYRFNTSSRSTLDVLLGVRAFKMDNQLKLKPLGEVNSNSTVYDAIIALRPRRALSEHWAFSPTLSVGSGDSDLTWELQPQFTYSNCNYEIRLGFRNLNYKFDNGNSKIDVAFRGPLIGFGWRF